MARSGRIVAPTSGTVPDGAALSRWLESFSAYLPRLTFGEAIAIRAQLDAGLIDGGTYDGKIKCFFATLARLRGIEVDDLVTCQSATLDIEDLFQLIPRGDTPATNSYAKLVADQLDEYLAQQGATV